MPWPLTPHAAGRLQGARASRFRAALRAVRFAALLALAGTAPAFAQKASSPVLPGGDSKEPINIDAAKLDYFDKEQKLVYTGDVVATQGQSRLKASALVLYLTPKASGGVPGAPSSSSQLRRMEASGPVTLVSKDQVGTGDSGVYEKAENKVYLIGNVTLTQGPNVTKGEKLVYDLATSQAVVTGRVRSMFIPGPASGNAQPGAAEGDGQAGPAADRKKPAKPRP